MAKAVPEDFQDGEISFYAKEGEGKRKLRQNGEELTVKNPKESGDGQEKPGASPTPPPPSSPPSSPQTPADGSDTNDSDKENVTPVGSPPRHVPLATDSVELGGFFGTGSPAVSEASTVVYDVPEVAGANDSFLLGDLSGASTSSPDLPRSPDVTYYYPETSSSLDRPSPHVLPIRAQLSVPRARRHLVFDDDQAVPSALKIEE